MSKQPREISIDWPPEGRTIVFKEREEKELDFIIPLESNRGKEENII